MAERRPLYLRLLAAQLRSQLQYRSSFVLMTLGTAFVTASEFVGVWALFQRFGNIRGWLLHEVAVLYGLLAVGFGVAEAFGRGFEHFSRYVRLGELNRLLLRPRTLFVQVSGQSFPFNRFGRALQGAIILGWGLVSASLQWTPAKGALLASALLGAIVLFFGVFLLTGTITFWTVEQLEVMSIVTNGAEAAGQYPLSIYRDFFRSFLLFVIPVGAVTYPPVVALLGKPGPLGFPEAGVGGAAFCGSVSGGRPRPVAPGGAPLHLHRFVDARSVRTGRVVPGDLTIQTS